MSLLKNLATSQDIEGEEDRLGGGGFTVESGLYDLTVKLAYLSESQGGATALNVTIETDDGKEIRQQFWLTSGREKGQKNYYVTEKGEKKYLPGFNSANSLCLLTIGKELSDVVAAAETKVIKLYDYETKAERNTEVPMLVELLNQRVTGGVHKQKVDKRVKGDDGTYRATGETRYQNEVNKFFRIEDGLTVKEIESGVTQAKFKEDWGNKWTGIEVDKSSGASAGTTSGAPSAANKPRTSLFGK